MNKLFFITLFALSFSQLSAQDHTSPYAGEEGRAIKSLSEQDIDAYLSGDGMGLAKAAELNQYPGPKHVLELAGKLKLTQQQIETTQKIYDDMHSEAVRIGAEIVRKEAALDSAFVAGDVDETSLADVVVEIGKLQGNLRFVHLKAHLRMKQVLSMHQMKQYDTLRGYASGHKHHRDHN